MPAGRPAYENSSCIVWDVVDHPDMPGFALYCAQLDQYAIDPDTKSVMWFASKREANVYKSSRAFRGI
jgi:hypothetical protein